MRVLVACEFTGTVREAFRARGHIAFSCDLSPTEIPGPHYQCDVLEVLRDGWDLMIGHPPCTFLCNAGARYLYQGQFATNPIEPERWRRLQEAADFFLSLWHAPIPRIALENPTMHTYAIEAIGMFPTQAIQPYQFGHGETKRTCLWLKNLPPLQSLYTVPERRHKHHMIPDRKSRSRDRSRTPEGIARAMAHQWGSTP